MAANTHSIDLEASSSQWLSRADSTELSITSDLTIELWVNPESQPATDATVGLAGKWAGGANARSYYFLYRDSGGVKQLAFETASTGADGTTIAVNQTLSNATWYHLAAVYTASAGSVQFYVNGVSVGTATGARTSLFDSGEDFQIGRYGSGSYFDGLIDEVRLWNVARTGTQILDNMNTELDSGAGTSLKGSWLLNNNLNDATGFGLTLTNNGSATFSTSQHPLNFLPSALSIAITRPLPTINVAPTVLPPVLSIAITRPIPTVTVSAGQWSGVSKSSSSGWSNTTKST